VAAQIPTVEEVAGDRNPSALAELGVSSEIAIGG